MFLSFDDDEVGAKERYDERVKRWEHLSVVANPPPVQGHSVAERKFWARAGHRFHWIVHNCIAHPLIGIAPIQPFFDLHDWTSKKLNRSK